MRKLLSKPAGSSHEPSRIDLPSSPTPLLYRPNGPQNKAFQAGHPITALDKSPDGRAAVLAGRHVLKTIRLDGSEAQEVCDLRALITASQPFRGNNNTSTADQLAIRDVKWSSEHGESTLFTACVTGNIFQYDLGHLGAPAPGGVVGAEVVQTREDSRQINTLDLNPHRNSYLLSGDQDGIVRCYDIRGPIHSRAGATFRPLQTFRGNADSVRHVKWSPKEGFFFVCATEQGVVAKWDLRKATAPLLRINAHDKACTGISWHPDGKHLISGGSDKKCHVWDMSKNADKRQKPKYTISTPYYVASLAWRPGQWSATCQGFRAAQVAVSYDTSAPKRSSNNTVHIWDLARPTIPYKTIQRFDQSPAAILWENQEFLWTAGTDGLFTQCDVAFAPQAVDRTAVSTLSFSSSGDVLAFLDERPAPTRPRFTTVQPGELANTTSPGSTGIPSSYGSDPTTPALSISRSDSEDEAIRSFLIPRRQARRKRRASSIQALGSTPPSGQQIPEASILSLEQAISTIGPYRPQQIMAIGHVAGAARKDIYGHLAEKYLEIVDKELPQASETPVALPDRVVSILGSYAQAAEDVQQFRLAQVWRILAFAMELLLKRRGQYHLERRLNPIDTGRKTSSAGADLSDPHRKSFPVRSLLTEEFESTSNVPTPLVRPAVLSSAVSSDDGHPQHNGSPEDKRFALPPAQHRDQVPSLNQARHRLNSFSLAGVSQDKESTRVSSLEGYDFYDTEALAKAIDVPSTAPRRRQSSALSFIGSESSVTREPVHRLDSNGSEVQLFQISQTSTSPGRPDGSASTRSHPPLAVHGYDHTGKNPSESRYEVPRGVRQARPDNSPIQTVKSSRLVHLNNALLSLEWSGSELVSQTTTTQDSSQYPTQNTGSNVLVSSPLGELPLQHTTHQVIHPRRHQNQGHASVNQKASQNPNPNHVTEQDFLPWPEDPPFPFPLKSIDSQDRWTGEGSCHGMDPSVILARALAFEIHNSPLHAASMILLLKPLVPAETIDPLLASSILRQHHARLISMKLFLEAALLRKLCVQGWPGGALSLWGDNYRSVTSPAQHNVAVSYMCSKCRKPREVEHTGMLTNGIWTCERCHAVMAPCAVCGHRDASPLPRRPSEQNRDGITPGLSTWWYCAECGHGGHSTCLEAWHSSNNLAQGSTLADHSVNRGGGAVVTDSGEATDLSGGCCPLDGCGHACLPGRWRAEAIAARSEAVSSALRDAPRPISRASSLISRSSSISREHRSQIAVGGGSGGGIDRGGGVRADRNEVGQSAAVDMVRESLGLGGFMGLAGIGREDMMRRSNSLGQSVTGDNRERERRKSVKFAGTRDREERR